MADYWRSPDEDYFISENIFLPYLNNQVEDSFNQGTTISHILINLFFILEYKLNFIKVNNITLFGSPLGKSSFLSNIEIVVRWLYNSLVFYTI